MIDLRFSNAGTVPLMSELGMPPVPVSRRRHHKHRHGTINGLSLSRDESIHKVDQRQNRRLQQPGDMQNSTGYGVPYGTAGLEVNDAIGFHQQQILDQVDGTYSSGIKTKHHRHHHRHNKGVIADQSDAVLEQLIGQRSSSIIGNERDNIRSPLARVNGEKHSGKRHHHRSHHHHHNGEHKTSHSGHHSRRVNNQHSHSAASEEGYGHINDELIFIERGDNSPHRQDPPSGYEYKGKIEVQCVEKESHSHSHSGTSIAPSQPAVPVSSTGPCPPGWHQVVLTAASGATYSSYGSVFTGQVTGSGLISGGASGNFEFGVGPSVTGGFGTVGSNIPIPPQGQLIADYIVEPGSNTIGGSDISNVGTSSGFAEFHGSVREHASVRPKIIEVWQKRQKPQTPDEIRSRSRSNSHGTSHREEQPKREQEERTPSRKPERVPSQESTFDFERFRSEILQAIGRLEQKNAPSTNIIQPAGQHGGTQTEIIHKRDDTKRSEPEKQITTGSNEVRVIVQPVQPVFYMPHPSQTTPSNNTGAQPPPVSIQPAAPSSTPKIIYVPRNVYVPVIKPVFVPRERVIVRPQVIHVARPVLVDRPVPVTQRPIIIDRERPIPVPVRGGGQAANATGGSTIVREEYVYRDNLPVAYGGRCPEVAAGVNYGYMPAQEEHQYTAEAAHARAAHTRAAHAEAAHARAAHAEAAHSYQIQGPVFDVTPPSQFQQEQSFAQGSSSNYRGLIEVLDPTVNSNWQRTDQSALINRYGQSALNIVEKTKQVEQQMYQELRHRGSSGDIQRSYSAGSFGSGFAPGVSPAGRSFS